MPFDDGSTVLVVVLSEIFDEYSKPESSPVVCNGIFTAELLAVSEDFCPPCTITLSPDFDVLRVDAVVLVETAGDVDLGEMKREGEEETPTVVVVTGEVFRDA